MAGESILNLNNKVAIVTGGSDGIGKEIVLTFTRQGANVVFTYLSNEEKATQLVSEVQSRGLGKTIAVKTDVSSERDVKHLFDKAEETYGQIHIVVNNAGANLHWRGTGAESYPPLANTTAEEWDHIFSVNTKGMFLCSKEGALRIPSNSDGRIVNITTTIVAANTPGYGCYAASKAAVETFTKILAKELRGRNITANCVAPGPVATEFFYRGKSKEMIEQQSSAPPLERIGQPKEIADVVLFVASKEGEWLNAQVIRANGGLA
jgi:3-oxoacyl-[acyl-carrier protein] reductase